MMAATEGLPSRQRQKKAKVMGYKSAGRTGRDGGKEKRNEKQTVKERRRMVWNGE